MTRRIYASSRCPDCRGRGTVLATIDIEDALAGDLCDCVTDQLQGSPAWALLIDGDIEPRPSENWTAPAPFLCLPCPPPAPHRWIGVMIPEPRPHLPRRSIA